MATSRTDSLIGSATSDYTTLQAWEDDIGVGLGGSTNLVTDDYDHHGWVKAGELDQELTISGHTTDATHRITLQSDHSSRPGGSGTPTDSFTGDADRELFYDTTYAAVITTSGYAISPLIQDDFTLIERLQFAMSSGNKHGMQLDATDITVNRCIFEGRGSSTSSSYKAFGVTNSADDYIIKACLFIEVAANYSYLPDEHPGKIYNCSFARSAGTTSVALATNYGRPDIQNNALFTNNAGSNSIGNSGSTSWTTLDYNVTDHSDISEDAGEGANNVYSKSQSDQWTAVDNTDWRLKAGNDLDGAGTNGVSADVTEDIFGNAYASGSWTVGCEATLAVVAYTQTQFRVYENDGTEV